MPKQGCFKLAGSIRAATLLATASTFSVASGFATWLLAAPIASLARHSWGGKAPSA